MARFFNLVHQPVPMAGGFDGDLAGLAGRIEKGTEGPAIMFDANGRIGLPILA
jgi:hypothetical protein